MKPFMIVYKDMDSLFHGLVRKGIAMGLDGEHYLVIIDENLSEAERLATLRHEIAHLWLGDCDFDCETWEERQRREAEANEFSDQMTDDLFREIMSYQIQRDRGMNEVI